MNYPDRFLTASEPCHLIFGQLPEGGLAPVCVVPWADDDNRGLPDWYFGLRPDGADDGIDDAAVDEEILAKTLAGNVGRAGDRFLHDGFFLA